MQPLYISDLDGTLLRKDLTLSDYTIDTLNSLTKQGLLFTIATARTEATVSDLLKPLDLSIPVILMNGVIIYHLSTKTYLKVHTLPHNTAKDILLLLKEHQLSPFMYELKDNLFQTYYEYFKNKSMYEFYEERAFLHNKKFVKTDLLSFTSLDHIIYFALLDTKEALEPVYHKVIANKELSAAFYRDIYSNEDIWYLEIFSVHASKYNGAKFLREELGYEYLVGMGDNLNDIPLFHACDESCAVANGKEEVKKIATHQILSNEEDGVARFIQSHFTIC